MAKAPSILGISVILGGIAGMTTAALLGLDTGGGFAVGFLVVFTMLFITSAFSSPVGSQEAAFDGKDRPRAEEKEKLEQLRAENRALRERVKRLEGLGGAFDHGGKVRGT